MGRTGRIGGNRVVFSQSVGRRWRPTRIQRYTPSDPLIIAGRHFPYDRSGPATPFSDIAVLEAVSTLPPDRVDLTNVTVRVLPFPVQEGAVLWNTAFANSGAPSAIHLPPIDLRAWVAAVQSECGPLLEERMRRSDEHADWYQGLAVALVALTPERYLAHILAHEFGHLLVFDLERQWGRRFLQKLKDTPYFQNCRRRGIAEVEEKYCGDVRRALHEAIADDFACSTLRTGLMHNEFWESDLALPKYARKGGELVADIVGPAVVRDPEGSPVTYPGVDGVAHAREVAREASEPGFWERIEQEALAREAEFGKD